jgi:stage III sporulation protein AC
MSIGLIFKIGAVGIIVSLLNQILKHSGRDDHAYLVSLAALVVVLSWLVPYIYELFSSISQLFSLE